FRVPLCSWGAAGHARRRRTPPALAALHLPSKSTSCQSLALCDGATSEKGQTIEPNVATRCQIWVNRVTLVVGRPLPVYPDQRTYLGIVGMSQRCQRATSTRSRSVRSGGRDRKLKESTSRLASGRPQPPTMGFDDRAADREA